jgi:hypothetical protein
LLEHALRIAGNLGDAERSVLIGKIESELETIREKIACEKTQQKKAS